jgi:hypothetical protein
MLSNMNNIAAYLLVLLSVIPVSFIPAMDSHRPHTQYTQIPSRTDDISGWERGGRGVGSRKLN